MNKTKFDALIHYICARCENPTELGSTKLNKILWYSDIIAFLKFGTAITDSVYIRNQFGPIPKDIKQARQRLAKSGAIQEYDASYHNYEQIQFISLREPDLSLFSAEEISLVDQVIGIITKGYTASSISALTHDKIWQIAELDEEIPLYTVFASRGGELTSDDIAWGKKKMCDLEPQRCGA
jgi:hypothetical protein